MCLYDLDTIQFEYNHLQNFEG